MEKSGYFSHLLSTQQGRNEYGCRLRFVCRILYVAIILVTYLLESNLLIKKEISETIVYDNIEMIRPKSRVEFIADLEKRLGRKINSVSLGNIDFLRDSVIVKVSYYE